MFSLDLTHFFHNLDRNIGGCTFECSFQLFYIWLMIEILSLYNTAFYPVFLEMIMFQVCMICSCTESAVTPATSVLCFKLIVDNTKALEGCCLWLHSQTTLSLVWEEWRLLSFEGKRSLRTFYRQRWDAGSELISCPRSFFCLRSIFDISWKKMLGCRIVNTLSSLGVAY